MRFEPSLPFPFSRLRHDDDVDFVDEIVVDAVDSPLLVVRLVRVVTVGDEVVILELRGKLSIDDCDDAILYSNINIYRHSTMGCFYCSTYSFVAFDGNAVSCLQNSSKLGHLLIS